MLNELSNADYNQGRMYDVILDCKEYDRCSEFKIQILKNKTRIFNIKFKLTNKEIGINIFNDVVKHYIETYDIAFDTYDNRHESEIRDYVIIGKNNINLNYKIPKEYFSTSMIVFKGELNKKGEKKLEKVK